MLIEANGYKKVDDSKYEFDASKWKLLDYKEFESFNAEWVLEEDPYDSFGSTSYHKTSYMHVQTYYDGSEWTGLLISYSFSDNSW